MKLFRVEYQGVDDSHANYRSSYPWKPGSEADTLDEARRLEREVDHQRNAGYVNTRVTAVPEVAESNRAELSSLREEVEFLRKLTTQQASVDPAGGKREP